MTLPTRRGQKLEIVLGKLERVEKHGSRYMACCPAHADRTPSLSVRFGDRGVLLQCYAGCTFDAICTALDVPRAWLFDDYEPPEARSSAPASPSPPREPGLTVAALCEHKRLSPELIASFGVRDALWQGRCCVHFSYRTRSGAEARTRVRTALTGDRRFRWGGSGDVIAYEPDGGKLARAQRQLVVVEGESDTLTLLASGFGALGLPGADQTKLLTRQHLEGIEHVFVVREPDAGGEVFSRKVPLALDALGFQGAVHVLELPGGAKDTSSLYVRDPAAFAGIFARILDDARQPPPRSRALSDLIDLQTWDGVALSTGFVELDQALDDGGIPTGSLVVIVGGPGSKKTGLATHFADTWSRAGAAVLFVAADESRRSVITRLGQRAGFNRKGLRDRSEIGEATRAEQRRRELELGRVLRIVELDDEADAQTLEEAHQELGRIAQGRTRVLVVDSLQTCRAAASDALERPDPRAIVDAKIATLKRARKSGTIVLLVSETNRAFYSARDKGPVSKEAVLGAARESSGVEFGVDFVLGMVRDRSDEDLVELVVAKSRIGREPRLTVRWDRDRATLSELGADAQATQLALELAPPSAADKRRSAVAELVLGMVRRRPGLTRSELRAALRRSRTAVYEAVDELVFASLVREEARGNGSRSPIFPMPDGSAA